MMLKAQIICAGAIVPTHNHPCIFSQMGSAACYFFSKSLSRTEGIYFVLKDEAAGIIDVFCTAKAEEKSRHLSTKLAGGFVWCFGTQAAVEGVGNCRHELHGRERFLKHYAVGNALYQPLVSGHPGHIDHREARIDLTCCARYLPAVEPSQQSDVSHEGAVCNEPPFKEGHGFLAGTCDSGLEAPLVQRILNEALDRVVILDDKDGWHFRQGFPQYSHFHWMLQSVQKRKVPWSGKIWHARCSAGAMD